MPSVSSSTASVAYTNAQSYVRERPNNPEKPPEQQSTQDNSDTTLSPTGRGQIVNIKA